MNQRLLSAAIYSLSSMVLVGSFAQAELTLKAEAIGPKNTTPFKTQLFVQVTNESFTSVSLIEKMKASELIVDGHSFKRTDVAVNGPTGLSPKESWEGCLNWDAYVSEDLPPGSHHLEWHMGNAVSEKFHATWPKPEPVAEIPKDRRRQVEALKEAIVPGLLRSCVENWLTERDGGLASSGVMRYYVHPGVKVLVPYDQSLPEPRVNGPIKVYLESRVAD